MFLWVSSLERVGCTLQTAARCYASEPCGTALQPVPYSPATNALQPCNQCSTVHPNSLHFTASCWHVPASSWECRHGAASFPAPAHQSAAKLTMWWAPCRRPGDQQRHLRDVQRCGDVVLLAPGHWHHQDLRFGQAALAHVWCIYNRPPCYHSKPEWGQLRSNG
jgi:hypothetical protein